MYTCIIIDDQAVSVEVLVSHVKKLPQLELKLATTDPHEGLTYLDKHKTDIVFVDIEMPDISGLDFVENLRNKWGNTIPKIVFTTSFQQYAIAGFEFGVTDYILKPIGFNRFKKSVDRILHDLEQNNMHKQETGSFFIESDGKKIRIDIDKLLFIEGAGNYITIYKADGRIMIHKSLNAIQEVLPAGRFMRVHKSYIVSYNKIHCLRGNTITIKYKEAPREIPIGVTYRKEVFERIKVL